MKPKNLGSEVIDSEVENETKPIKPIEVYVQLFKIDSNNLIPRLKLIFNVRFIWLKT